MEDRWEQAIHGVQQRNSHNGESGSHHGEYSITGCAAIRAPGGATETMQGELITTYLATVEATRFYHRYMTVFHANDVSL